MQAAKHFAGKLPVLGKIYKFWYQGSDPILQVFVWAMNA